MYWIDHVCSWKKELAFVEKKYTDERNKTFVRRGWVTPEEASFTIFKSKEERERNLLLQEIRSKKTEEAVSIIN